MSPNVTRIEDDAFNNCHNLEQLEIPKNVSYIGKRAFQNCAGDLFIDCDIPSAKNMFADAPFWGSYFSSITIGPHVNTIGELAFYQAGPNLTRINISEGVKTIERKAFSSNGHLLEINIPQSVTEIGEHAFSGCTGRLKINCNIPSHSKEGRPFEANGFTSIIIGENVDIIGDYAFLESSDLIGLTLVYGTTKIGNSAFCLCEQLRAINIPGSVVEIGEKAFLLCENTTEVIIPSSVREIGNDAFAYCSGILHMNCNVPSSTDASSKIFDCSTFSSVIFGESVTSIGKRAFQNCETIKTLQFPQNLLNIGYCAFRGCSSLTMDLEIPQNVTTIGAWAFAGCHFRSLTIPQSVVDIGASAFSASAGDIENSTLYINCQIPSIENYLDDSPFSGTGFDHIVIGDGITTIGAGAFSGTSYIASLTLPASLKTIEERAFKGSHIATIYCKASIPPQIKKESPWTTISLLECIVYVPESCRNAYINDSYWKSAQAIEEIIY